MFQGFLTELKLSVESFDTSVICLIKQHNSNGQWICNHILDFSFRAMGFSKFISWMENHGKPMFHFWTCNFRVSFGQAERSTQLTSPQEQRARSAPSFTVEVYWKNRSGVHLLIHVFKWSERILRDFHTMYTLAGIQNARWMDLDSFHQQALKSLNFSQNFSVKMGRSETPRATPRKGRDWVPEARNGLETSDSTNFLWEFLEICFPIELFWFTLHGFRVWFN